MDAAIRRIAVPAVGHFLRQACGTDGRDGGVPHDVVFVVGVVGCRWRHWHGRGGNGGCRGSIWAKGGYLFVLFRKTKSSQ